MWGLLSGLLIFSIAIGNLMRSKDSRGRSFSCVLSKVTKRNKKTSKLMLKYGNVNGGQKRKRNDKW